MIPISLSPWQPCSLGAVMGMPLQIKTVLLYGQSCMSEWQLHRCTCWLLLTRHHSTKRWNPWGQLLQKSIWKSRFKPFVLQSKTGSSEQKMWWYIRRLIRATNSVSSIWLTNHGGWMKKPFPVREHTNTHTKENKQIRERPGLKKGKSLRAPAPHDPSFLRWES